MISAQVGPRYSASLSLVSISVGITMFINKLAKKLSFFCFGWGFVVSRGGLSANMVDDFSALLSVMINPVDLFYKWYLSDF